MNTSLFTQLYFLISLKAALLLLLAAGLQWLLPKATAATRHLIWAVAIIAALGLPLFTVILPSWQWPILPWVDLSLVKRAPETMEVRSNLKYAAPLDALPTDAIPPQLPLRAAPIDWATWLMALWAVVAWLILARGLVGVVCITLLKRRAYSLHTEPWLTLLAESASALGLKRRVKLFLSDEVSVPLTTGIFAPVVVLPRAAFEWPRHQVHAVLLHELAHIKRRDCLTQILAHLACALYWCNPLVWVVVAQMRVTREKACDDEVLMAGTRASEYARYLVTISQAAHGREYNSPVAVGMACSQLSDRVTAILNPALNRRPITRRVVMFIVLLLTTLVIPLATIDPVLWAASIPSAAPAAAILQSQDAQKQQHEAEKHWREIEKHRREIREVHQREIEKHLRELEKLQGAALSEEMKARLEAELKRTMEMDRAAQRDREEHLRASSANEIEMQKKLAEAEHAYQLKTREAQQRVQEELARALQAQQASEMNAQLLESRARLNAELQRLQRTYKDSHPDVKEQQDRLAALNDQLAAMARENAGQYLSQSRARMELQLAELEEHLKTLRRNYTDKHPDVQAVREQIQALQRELELLRK